MKKINLKKIFAFDFIEENCPYHPLKWWIKNNRQGALISWLHDRIDDFIGFEETSIVTKKHIKKVAEIIEKLKIKTGKSENLSAIERQKYYKKLNDIPKK